MGKIAVAPLVGAWIEIRNLSTLTKNLDVAPLVGAWIEIINRSCKRRYIPVAPLVGAWIEIKEEGGSVNGRRRRSPRGSVD